MQRTTQSVHPLKLTGIILLSVGTLIAAPAIVFYVSSIPPKESKVTNDFRTHRAEYEQVRKMLLEDKGVDLVPDWGILKTNDPSPMPKTPPDGGMSVNRYQEYIALLKQIGALQVEQVTEPAETRFRVWAAGFGGSTRHVAVSWLERKPPNLVTSLDAFYRDKQSSPSYVHIEGDWYIWADW